MDWPYTYDPYVQPPCNAYLCLMSHTALLIGGTGLVGSALVELLKEDTSFEAVHDFGRRAASANTDRFISHTINFDEFDSWKDQLQGDVLFSSLGTTIKKAGSKDAQYRIDYTYQYETAKAAADNGVKHYVLISAAGADAGSSVFYSKIKGELEDAVIKLPFEKITIIQPSLLTGPRNEVRLGEKISGWLMFPLQFIPFIRKYRSISSNIVAQAMLNAFRNPSSKRVRRVAWGEVFDLAEEK